MQKIRDTAYTILIIYSFQVQELKHTNTRGLKKHGNLIRDDSKIIFKIWKKKTFAL